MSVAVFVSEKTDRMFSPVFSLVLLLASAASISGARILLLPLPAGGHLAEATNLGKALVNKGHEVYATRSNIIDPKRLDVKGLKFIDYVTIDPSDLENTPKPNTSLEFMTQPQYEANMGHRPFFMHECKMMVENPKIVDKIRSLKFDLIFVDGLNLCYYLIPYKLGIPFVTTGTYFSSAAHGLDRFEYGLPCDVRSMPNTLWNRYQHIQNVQKFESTTDLILDHQHFLKDTPFSSLNEIVRKSKLFLHNSNDIIDCPKPKHPKIVQIGGIGIQTPKPLTEEFESFYATAKDGVIVLALGSIIDSIPDHVAKKFIQSFEGLKQKVVWRCNLDKDTKITKLPSNVMIKDWLPLGDMLADKRTVLLMYHGGNIGQTEAVYHGVPMITIPLFGDQPYHARRAEYKGYGLTIDIFKFTPEELKEKISEIVGNPKYTKRMKQVSELFHYDLNKSKPNDRVTDAVEKLLKYGDEHLQINSDYLTPYQLRMWDFVGIVICGSFFCLLVLLWLIKSCFKQHNHKKTD